MQKFAHLIVCICVYFAFDRSIDVNHLNPWTICCTDSIMYNPNVPCTLHSAHTHIWFSYLFAGTNVHICASVPQMCTCTFKKMVKFSIKKSIILGHHRHQFGSNGLFFVCFTPTNVALEWNLVYDDDDDEVSAQCLNLVFVRCTAATF